LTLAAKKDKTSNNKIQHLVVINHPFLSGDVMVSPLGLLVVHVFLIQFTLFFFGSSNAFLFLSYSSSLTRREILTNVVVSPFLVVASMTTTTTTTTTTSATTASARDSSEIIMPPNIRWGIVGLGDVCQKKSGPAFWKCNGSELVAVMRRTPGKAAEFAERVPGGGCVGYDNLEDFLTHEGLDAVYVSTRPGQQFEICQKVAAAGKACYVEKPVGRCAEETQAIMKSFEDAKLPLHTAYISRAYERTQAIRKLLQEGVIGDRCDKVTYKLVGTGGARDMDGPLPWRLDAEQSGGGLIMDVGCHVLDRIDYLCGPLQNVIGKAENKNSPNQPVEDFVSLTATIGNGSWAAIEKCEGASVECTWDFASKGESCDELRLVGPKGALKMAGMSFGPIQVLDTKGEMIRELTFGMPEHTAQELIQAMTDDLRGVQKKDCLSYGGNALRTQRVLDTVLGSYYGGREIGYWNRVESWPGRAIQTQKQGQTS
jgi:1,5-anhydro-D-fructose reductase (1,5-anhydro-D-mannitol-forming)